MKATPSNKSITIGRKRGHYNTACAMCHKRKTKCDGIKPTCKPCLNSGRESDCLWVRPTPRSGVNRIDVHNPNEAEKIPEVRDGKYINIQHDNAHASQ